MQRALIAGVGMTPFTKPGKTSFDYIQLAASAARSALDDCHGLVKFEDVQTAICGFVYNESCAGNRACYELGMTGIPIINVNNNCSTGSTALRLAYQMVRGGLHECVLVLGFEKMQPGPLRWGANPDTESPMQRFYDSVARAHPEEVPSVSTLANPCMFAMVAREHMKRYGSTKEHFAMVGVKNHAHSANNPYSQFRDIYTLQQILESPIAHDPLTRLQCSPTSDGAAAALVVSEDFAREKCLLSQCVEVVGCEMRTDTVESVDGSSAINAVGFGMARTCAQKLYSATGIMPADIQVIELHDCFSANELISYESLGLCSEGQGHKLIERGDTTHGGKWLVNPSGGLISKGHPLGATGLAQAAECVWQIRGDAGLRQRKGCEVAMSMNLGMGGAVVCTMYKAA